MRMCQLLFAILIILCTFNLPWNVQIRNEDNWISIWKQYYSRLSLRMLAWRVVHWRASASYLRHFHFKSQSVLFISNTTFPFFFWLHFHKFRLIKHLAMLPQDKTICWHILCSSIALLFYHSLLIYSYFVFVYYFSFQSPVFFSTLSFQATYLSDFDLFKHGSKPSYFLCC